MNAVSNVLFWFAGKFYGFTVYMVCANCIVNPFVYVIQYHEFQNRMKEIFCRKQKPLEERDTGPVMTTNSTVDTETKQ